MKSILLVLAFLMMTMVQVFTQNDEASHEHRRGYGGGGYGGMGGGHGRGGHRRHRGGWGNRWNHETAVRSRAMNDDCLAQNIVNRVMLLAG